MQKLRYRLYPRPHPQAALAGAFGCARVVRNDALALSHRLHRQGQQFPGGTERQKLRTLLASKAEQQGRKVVAVNRWLSTSRTCSACGHNACGAERLTGLSPSGCEAGTHLKKEATCRI
ncbi:MAG: transposase [Synechococcus sp. SB0673_bin_10]|nr:zinc ribbon domain-containing protein [Cyanobacteria bacterium MAG IRC3_bin_20]MXX09230.1 transposase [Synechococcus sp. SB0667_bin_8]MYG63432.1 transposase [Synechococcus sp. SB0675_bin_7]MYI71112.1 transposase [Synechococcus sp. SB0673_bin_10]MYK85750.1 transposase [Synechococcus sp. SB0669_bin_7]